MARNELYAQELRNYRYRHGLTVPQYADQLGIGLRTIYRWTAGGGINALLWLDVARIHGVDPRSPETLGFRLAGHTPAENPADDESKVELMLRRDALGLTAGLIYSTTIAEHPVSALLRGPQTDTQVGAADVERLRDARRHLRLSCDTAGAGAMGATGLTRERFDTLVLLRGRFASDKSRRQAHAEAAGLLEEVGWNLYDLGHHDRARVALAQGLAVAREADRATRPFLQAHLLIDMAKQSVTLNQPRRAMHLLSMTGGTEHELSPTLRALLSLARATATAALGHGDATRRHIGWAQDHINDAADDRDAAWNVTGWFNEGEMASHASHALTTLAGHHEDQRDAAMAAITRASDSLIGTQARERARVQNSLTKLHAIRQNAAATVEAGNTAVSLARRLRSPRVKNELREVRRQLNPMWRRPGIRSLARQIDDLTTPPGPGRPARP